MVFRVDVSDDHHAKLSAAAKVVGISTRAYLAVVLANHFVMGGNPTPPLPDSDTSRPPPKPGRMPTAETIAAVKAAWAEDAD